MNTAPDFDPDDRRDYAGAYESRASVAEAFSRLEEAAHPPWSVGAGIVVWVTSVLLIFVAQAVGLGIYFAARRASFTPESLTNLESDPNILLVGVVATLPAHLLTLGLVWLVATNSNRYEFWRAIRWGKLDLRSAWTWTAAAAAVWVVVQFAGGIVVRYTGASETAFDALIESSAAARVAISLLAVLSAPIVEELVYRGVLFPALRRATGARWAIVIVAGLFAGVHFAQYAENPGLIFAVTLLSVILTVVRWRTDSLAPCFVIHLVFNFITATMILFYPNIGEQTPTPPPPVPAIRSASSATTSPF